MSAQLGRPAISLPIAEDSATATLAASRLVHVGTLTAYQHLVIGNAIAFPASAAILTILPPVTPRPTPGDPRWIALRNRPYLLLTTVDGYKAASPTAGGGAYRRDAAHNRRGDPHDR